LSFLDQFDPCPDCGGHHLPGSGLPPGPPFIFLKLAGSPFAPPTPQQVQAVLAQKAQLLKQQEAPPELRGKPLGKQLTAKKAQRKRIEKNKVPICLACGDLCDRDDWLDFVSCLTCQRALGVKDVEWVSVEKLLGYQSVRRSIRQLAARRIAKWIKKQLG
jgi:hypothetical protein